MIGRATLDAARSRAETTLQASCTVTRPVEDDTPTIDPQTLQVTRGAPVTIWVGDCSLIPERSGTGRTEGSEDLIVGAWVWVVPTSAPEFRPGDIVTVNAPGCSDTPALPAAFTVKNASPRSNQVLRRVSVVTQPRAARL